MIDLKLRDSQSIKEFWGKKKTPNLIKLKSTADINSLTQRYIVPLSHKKTKMVQQDL